MSIGGSAKPSPPCGSMKRRRRFETRSASAEKEDVFGARWWTLHEIATSTERFYPRSLAAVLPVFLRGETVEEGLESWP
ncbi:MAG: hypothetical protein ACREUC_06760 [Steroidobacteraceae bacterium]